MPGLELALGSFWAKAAPRAEPRKSKGHPPAGRSHRRTSGGKAEAIQLELSPIQLANEKYEK